MLYAETGEKLNRCRKLHGYRKRSHCMLPAVKEIFDDKWRCCNGFMLKYPRVLYKSLIDGQKAGIVFISGGKKWGIVL